MVSTRSFMLKLRQLTAIVLCLVLFSSTSNAWFNVGHMAVAYVAYQQLTAEKKLRVAKLLKKNPYYNKQWKALIPTSTPADRRDLMLFMIAATWPDEIKEKGSAYQNDGDTSPTDGTAWTNTGYGDLKQHRYWHFIDTPFTQDNTAPLAAIPSPNAETQIAVFRQTLTSGSNDKLKSYDLVWLLHLVGDIHQPLHCTTRITQAKPNGDLGGNLVTLSGNPNELHAYWDDLLGMGSTQNYGVAVTAALALAPARAKAAADLKTEDWVNESFALAKSRVYAEPIEAGMGPYTIGKNSKYERQSIAVAKRRVALAGARLANVLNAELK